MNTAFHRQLAARSIGELSAREREVLGLMAESCSNSAICARLFLSPRTVESHVRQIFTKLGLIDTPDLDRRVLAVLAYHARPVRELELAA